MTEAEQRLDATLRSHDIDRDDLLAALDSVVDPGTYDMAFAYGSLIEGLGNPSSDLDIALITHDADVLSPADNRAFHIAGLQCDALFLPQQRIAALSRQLHTLGAKYPRDQAFATSYPERRMMHALLDGTKIRGAGALADRHGLDRGDLSAHLIAGARYWLGNMQVDLAGMHAQGDHVSMIFLAQEVVLRGVDIVLADAGLTNPNPKWRAALLRKLGPRHGSEWHQTGQDDLLDVVFDLHRAPRRPDPHAALAHALAAVNFARRAVLAHILGTDRPAQKIERREAISPGYPSLDLDVIFEPVADGIAVLRPDSDRNAVIVSREDAEWLHCLGAARGTRQSASAAAPVQRLVRLLAIAGFITRP